MSDQNTNEAPVGAAEKIMQVPVVKAKTSIPVNVGLVPDKYYDAALAIGLKQMVNGGATKITESAYPDETERHAKALSIAEDRVEQMYAEKLVIRGAVSAKKDGVPAAVKTEARRIARDMVKATIKDKGMKVSHFAASDITAAANAMIEEDPSIIAQAELNLANRGKLKINSDVISGLHEDPKLVAAAEASKAKKKSNAGILSAAKAGQTKHHATGTAH